MENSDSLEISKLCLCIYNLYLGLLAGSSETCLKFKEGRAGMRPKGAEAVTAYVAQHINVSDFGQSQSTGLRGVQPVFLHCSSCITVFSGEPEGST